MIHFFQPIWLLLLIPLAVVWLIWPLPSRGLRIVRAFVFVLIVLALAQFAVRLPERAGTVVVVADRSESMPRQAAAAQKEIVDLLQKSMRANDLLGVVSFGRHAVVERSPQRGAFGGFTAQPGSEHSDLNGAIEAALALIPPDAGGRILVVSDGKWTGRDPLAAAARAAGRGVAIDYRVLARPQVSDVAIQSFQGPDAVQPGEAYVLGCWIRAPSDQEVGYELRRGSTIIASGTRPLVAGVNRIMFRDRAADATVHEYSLLIRGPEDDPVPENNEARLLVSVEGARPMLAISAAGGQSGLVQLLRRGGLEIEARMPQQCQWTLEELARYSSVLIENVPANAIGPTGMETLASWVEDSAGGLMLTGGQKSYGPGGYFKSPLDRIMPVSMEMRQEHRKMLLAIAVALDRSGSMQMPVSGGRVKMDLANLGTVQVLDLLSPMDEIGVIAVDSSPHVIVDLDTVERNAGQRGRILSIDSRGGGIFVYEALSAAASMLLKAKAQTRHIILFADAADSEEPGAYVQLLEKCREAGVTVSVIGLGTEADVDANLLKDIAERGGGNWYFTDSPEEIPRLFAQDTFTVARSTFIDEPTPIELTAGFSLLGSPPAESPPAPAGYNLTYLKPEANLAARTLDEYAAPFVASWNAGNGRVLCFMGEADGKFSGEFVQWAQIGEFYATLARWTAGRRQPLPDDLLLTQEVRDGVCLVQLHLDPDRQMDPFAALPRVKVLHGLPGAIPGRQNIELQWKSADLLEATIPISGKETLLNTVEIDGQEPVTLPPVCLPYSPEFAPDQPGRGIAALEQLAAATGGKERLEIPQIWADLQARPRFVNISPWLLVTAVILFLAEVFERRTGFISRWVRRQPAAQAVEEEISPAPAAAPFWARFKWKRRMAAPKPTGAATASRPSAEAKKPAPAVAAPEPAAESSLDAMRKARERASRRTTRE
ncbi:MAG TPA: VWA domain-containing protein [Verrucomicrobiota bacterium]|nr:VWA domain-containing protein [Verrucomicrobiota bacterium]